MGIVNVTPDSFSDGGEHETTEQAIAHAKLLINQGADILDIGGESTRPGAAPVSVDEELQRVLPVLRGVIDLGVPISIDTRRPQVMAQAVAMGVDLLNDVNGFRDPLAFDVAVNSSCGLCIMHMLGEPRTMQDNPQYGDVVAEVTDFLMTRCQAFVDRGVDRRRLLIDPGFGFGKNLDHNLALLRGMLGKPAAGLLPLRGHSNVQGIGTVGVKPILAEDVLQQLEQHTGAALPRTAGMDTLACLGAAHAGEIDAALIMGGNLFAATPNSDWAKAALDKIGFKVYLTTTLNLGHVTGMETSEALILPVTARDEEWQPTTQESMFNYVRLSDGGIHRLHNVRPEVEILCELGKRLQPDCPLDFQQLKQHDSIRAAIAATIPGMRELKDIAQTKQEFTIQDRLLVSPEFHTPNGKAQFQVGELPAAVANTEYPFVLASIRSEGQFNSIIYEEADSYRGTDTRWSVLMNKKDMEDLAISTGDLVNLKSAQGEMKAVKVFAFDVPRGNLMAYYPEANVLIATHHDPRSKTPAFKSVPVKLSVEQC